MQQNALQTLRQNATVDNWRHVDNIISYIASDGAIKLTHAENEIYQRIVFADEMLRQCTMPRMEIRNTIMQRFGVSRETANRDLVDAEFIFASTAPMNKRYKIGVRIEVTEQHIQKAKDAQDWAAVAKLEAVLAKYLEIYPDVKKAKRPQVLIFQMPAEVKEQTIDYNEALQIADDHIHGKNQSSKPE